MVAEKGNTRLELYNRFYQFFFYTTFHNFHTNYYSLIRYRAKIIFRIILWITWIYFLILDLIFLQIVFQAISEQFSYMHI